jgi:hypothetical protein
VLDGIQLPNYATYHCSPCFQIISLHVSVIEELKETLPVIFVDVFPVGNVAEKCSPRSRSYLVDPAVQ